MAAALYIAYGALFVRLFVHRYVRPAGSKRAPSNGEQVAGKGETRQLVLDEESGHGIIGRGHPDEQLNGKGKGV